MADYKKIKISSIKNKKPDAGGTPGLVSLTIKRNGGILLNEPLKYHKK